MTQRIATARPVIIRIKAREGDRIVMDTRTTEALAVSYPRASFCAVTERMKELGRGLLAGQAEGPSRVAMWVERSQLAAARVRVLDAHGEEQEPSIESLVWAFWYLSLSKVDRVHWRYEEKPLPVLLGFVEIWRGELVLYRQPMYMTGNRLEVYRLEGQSDLFDPSAGMEEIEP